MDAILFLTNISLLPVFNFGSVILLSSSLVFLFCSIYPAVHPTQCILYLSHRAFHLEIICVFFMFYMSEVLNIWDTVIMTVSMSLSAIVNICFSASVLGEFQLIHLTTHYEVIIFLLICIPSKFWLDVWFWVLPCWIMDLCVSRMQLNYLETLWSFGVIFLWFLW